MSLPPIIADLTAATAQVRAWQREGLTVGVVPTMGALHAGHLSLVQAARQECQRVVTTVFVNPTQFSPSEDFSRYPRDLARDAELLATAGCDAIFAPPTEAMYPAGFATSVDVGPVARPWEGTIRPTHFAGVATVVLKLFQIVPADFAYFGRKDYQQTVVVRRMASDLNLPVTIRICPTVREADGLAMSSRNAYLSAAERAQAAVLSRSLQLAESLIAAGERDAMRLEQAIRDCVASEPGVKLDYVAIVDDGDIQPITTITGPATIALAARVGTTRLIDNIRVVP